MLPNGCIISCSNSIIGPRHHSAFEWKKRINGILLDTDDIIQFFLLIIHLCMTTDKLLQMQRLICIQIIPHLTHVKTSLITVSIFCNRMMLNNITFPIHDENISKLFSKQQINFSRYFRNSTLLEIYAQFLIFFKALIDLILSNITQAQIVSLRIFFHHHRILIIKILSQFVYSDLFRTNSRISISLSLSGLPHFCHIHFWCRIF